MGILVFSKRPIMYLPSHTPSLPRRCQVGNNLEFQQYLIPSPLPLRWSSNPRASIQPSYSNKMRVSLAILLSCLVNSTHTLPGFHEADLTPRDLCAGGRRRVRSPRPRD